MKFVRDHQRLVLFGDGVHLDTSEDISVGRDTLTGGYAIGETKQK